MFKHIILILFIISTIKTEDCIKLNASLTQNIEDNGFHKYVHWLLELHTEKAIDLIRNTRCRLNLYIPPNAGFYVDPDEVSSKTLTYTLNDKVNIEAPAHEAQEISVMISTNYLVGNKYSFEVPIHLRYQRAQITGGFGKIQFNRPWLVTDCADICSEDCGLGRFQNVTYNAMFDHVEMYVPIGDLDDYPLVSIVSLILGCSGCFYVLSILSSSKV